MRTVTVLGASGFLGGAVAEALAARPVRLRLVSRRPAAVRPGAVADVEVRTADVTEPGAVADAVAGSDAVVYALRPGGYWRDLEHDPASRVVAVGAMRAVVEAFRSTADRPLCVYTGSHLGRGDAEPHTEYERQKRDAERVLLDAHADGVLRGIGLRLPVVFGPEIVRSPSGPGSVVGMVRRAFAGQPLTYWDDGTLRRHFMFVEDAVSAVLTALDLPGPLVGRCWSIASPAARELRDVFGVIARAVAERTGLPPVPVVSTPAPADTDARDFQHDVIDPGPFHDAVGWTPRVGLEEGVARTVAALAGSGSERPGAAPAVAGARAHTSGTE
ncbi:NAD-dependent epimerase/dehydratase family protein [Saccharothrix saharensis]|uniref:NAD-dependent epimerase/dehydratase family protein n=1 Tax=Saccharothrix saharensis TaxID=571190 RepID=UPI0036AC05C4